MEKEKLIHEINGEKYIVINDIVTREYDLKSKKYECLRLKGIFLGVNERQTDWLGEVKQIKFSVLLPIEKANKWDVL